MDSLGETFLSLEDGLDSSDTTGLLASWDWKSRARSYELHQASPTQSLSPVPSLESYSSSPCPAGPGLPCGHSGASTGGSDGCSSLEAGGLIELDYNMLAFQPAYLQGAGGLKGQKGSKVKMSVQRRRKASEREKLRMRTLADALHTLRNYLPPVYSQRGQPLTKIQTLKYTIKYIGNSQTFSTGQRAQAPECVNSGPWGSHQFQTFGQEYRSSEDPNLSPRTTAQSYPCMCTVCGTIS